MQNNPRVGVGVFIFRNGKFLIGRRQGSHGEGSWSVPGGHLEFGESPEVTAKREVLEETGLAIKNVRFGAVTNDVFLDEDKHYVTLWMLSDWLRGEPRVVEPNKYVKLAWVDFDSLPEPLFLPWQQLQASPFFDEIKKQLRHSTLPPS